MLQHEILLKHCETLIKHCKALEHSLFDHFDAILPCDVAIAALSTAIVALGAAIEEFKQSYRVTELLM